MKTVLIIHHVSELGGGTNSLFDLALMLQKNYRPIICVPANSREIRRIAEQYGIEVYEIKTPIPSLNVYSGMPGYFNRYFLSRLLRFRNNKHLVEELLILKPDAICFNTSVTALIAQDIPKGIKKICIVRETFIPSIFNGVIRKNLAERFDGIGYIAEHEKNFININGPKQVVIPDSLVPQAYEKWDKVAVRKEYNIPANVFCVLFMGGLVPIKGLDIMLKAVEKLDDSVVTIIAGKIDKRVFSTRFILTHFHNVSYVRFVLSVRNRLERLRKTGKVIEMGYVRDITPYMIMCDTVVFPSTAAHQPRPCIEAGFFKRSCILSDYDATKEYFKDGYNALTFEPGKHMDLVKKIKYLQANPDLNRQLAANNYKMSTEKHDFEKIRTTLKNFFEELLS